MALLRLLGGFCLIIAVIALVADMTHRASGPRNQLLTPVAQHWGEIAPGTLTATQRLVRAGLHPAAWDWAVRPLIALPTAVVFGVAGCGLAYAGRRRRRINIFRN